MLGSQNSRWAWYVSRSLPFLLVGVVAILVVGAVTLYLQFGQDRTSESIESPSATKMASAQPDPPELVDTKSQLDDVTHRFVRVYFSRDKKLLRLSPADRQIQFESRLDGLVTQSFLDEGVTPVGTEHVNSLASVGGYIDSRLKYIESGHFEDDHADADIVVSRVIYRPDVPTVRMQTTFRVSLIYFDEAWLVSSVQEQY